MKKSTVLIIIALMVFPAISLFSQSGKSTDNITFAFYEDFSGLESLPDGWSVMGLGNNNWKISNTDDASGIAPELHFDWSPSIDGTTRLVTPAINSEGLSEIALSFKHYFHFYIAGTDSIKIETTSDGGATWNQVWAHYLTATIEPETKSLNITTPDVGSTNLQIAFTFAGNSYNIYDWKIDEVAVGDPFSYDASVTMISIPELINAGNTISPAAVVKNKGQEVASFDATFMITEQGGAVIYSEMLPVVDLVSDESTTLTFPDWVSVEGVCDAKISVNLSGDEDPNNNEITKQINVINDLILIRPLFQVFTSSTCSPCTSANEVLDGILANNEESFSLIKYQTPFPGDGDPYACSDVDLRVDYYGIQGVPTMFVNNAVSSHPYYFTQQKFEELAMVQTFMDISIENATINSDNLVELIATIDVTENYSAGLTAHIAIVEKMTTGNVGTNGETEFYNVLMKMIPDGDGIELGELTPGNSTEVSGSQNMSLTFMEEAEDLAIIVFVQKDSDKSIIQSNMIDVTLVTGLEDTNSEQENIQLYPNPANEKVSIRGLNINEVTIFNIVGQVIEKTEESIINTTSYENGLYIFRIKTEDGRTIVKRVEIVH